MSYNINAEITININSDEKYEEETKDNTEWWSGTQ